MAKWVIDGYMERSFICSVTVDADSREEAEEKFRELDRKPSTHWVERARSPIAYELEIYEVKRPNA